MAGFQCGDRLQYGRFSPGTAGCLLRFAEIPSRLLLLAAGHVVLPPFAQQGDAITADGTDDIIGRLFTWTTIDGDPTTDAALIWVDPDKVLPQLRGLGAPRGVNDSIAVGDLVRIVPHDGQQLPRESRVKSIAGDVDVMVIGPGWDVAPTVTYRRQILTEHQISEGGDSGGIALDQHGRVVGMVVAGSVLTGTVITPISAILRNPAWAGMNLDVVSDKPTDVVPPPRPGRPPVPPLPQDNFGLDLSWLTAQQAAVARQVIALLAAAGFGRTQVAAALANAMAESSLDPKARLQTAKEDSVGLFQFNRRGGEGTGCTVEQLESIAFQCEVVGRKMGKQPEFMQTGSSERAVLLFIEKFERPADPGAAFDKRVPIARRFLPA